MAVALLALAIGGRVCAQPSFTLSVSDSPDPVEANRPLTYLINVTNATASLLNDVFVTNRFSGPVEITGATNGRLFGSVVFTTNMAIFLIPTFPGAGGYTELSVGVRPRAFGLLTNTISVGTFGLGITNALTNVVTQVTAGQPDLDIAIRAPAQPLLVNDWFTYTLAAGNVGADAAPNVVVSNALPADVKIISIVPSNEVVTVTSNILSWAIDRLGIGELADLRVTLQPTNVGVVTITASISATNTLDTNTVNNAASTNILVGPLISGWLVASNLSAMAFNPQTGLMEQMVRLVNVSGTSAPSARLMVTGLTNWLYSAVGTNDGDPFVVHGAELGAGQSVDLLLEYFVPNRLPTMVENSQLLPFVSPSINLTPPTGTPLSPPAPRIVLLSSGSVLLEFPTSPGQTYVVAYRDRSITAEEMAAQPPVVATANRVQWTDSGPPKTISLPARTGARFYRIIQMP